MKTKIYIKKINKDIELPKIIDKGEWIDLRASGDYEIKRGDLGKIPLGVAIKIPKGYELNILPRSSTPLQFKVLLANSQGIGDYTFSGNKDEYQFVFYALRSIKIKHNSRICQFRISLSQKATVWQKLKLLFSNGIEIIEVDNLSDVNRGGIGSTGIDNIR